MAINLGNIDLSNFSNLNIPAADPNVQTALGAVRIGTPGTDPSTLNPKDIDALIKARTPEALRLVREGSAEQLRLAELAGQAQREPLEQFDDLRAFEEQAAILGLSGQPAQEQAISGIPVSDFQRELNRRQLAQQQRQAFASGDVSGASLLAGQQLAAGQQADIITRRLAELEPLAGQARTIRSTLSELDEAARNRQAQILGARGTQLSNIRIGGAAPVISGIQQRADISGLQGIAAANERGQLTEALAGLGGRFFQSQPVQSGINTAVNLGGFDRAGFGTDEFGLTAFQDPFA